MDHDTVQVYIKDEDRQWREGYYQLRESWLGALKSNADASKS